MTDITQAELDRINTFWREQHEKQQFKTELTPIGEQYVVPGCERQTTPKIRQLGLWDV